MKVAVAVLLASLSALVAPTAPPPAAAAASAQPDRITVIGDSILTAVQWNPQPLAILEQGLPRIDLQIAVCRRLTGSSCPFDGERPSNLVDLVQSLGDEIGSTVVVEVGYNDPAQGFAAAVDDSVQALLAAGVQRILWVNYHDWVPEYTQLNSILAQVLAKYPQVTIVDWQADSLNQYSWFQSDGIHLVFTGAVALATLIHDELVRALTPPIVPYGPAAIFAQVGSRFTTRLDVTGGEGPFRWRVTGRALGRGVHLLADGILCGTPRTPGQTSIDLQVSDAWGDSAPLRIELIVRPRGSPR